MKFWCKQQTHNKQTDKHRTRNKHNVRRQKRQRETLRATRVLPRECGKGELEGASAFQYVVLKDQNAVNKRFLWEYLVKQCVKSRAQNFKGIPKLINLFIMLVYTQRCNAVVPTHPVDTPR